MPLDYESRLEVEKLIAEKLDILSSLRALPDGVRELLAAEIEQFFYSRQSALRKPENTYTPRWTKAGADINFSSGGVGEGHAGPTLPRTIDLLSGTAYLDADDPSILHFTGGGAGADCLFDYLVSPCFATLSGFTEGQVFTSLSGCTFIGYSNLASLFTALNALTSAATKTVCLCAGTYTVQNIPINLNVNVGVNIFGASRRAVTIDSTATAANSVIFDMQSTGADISFHNVRIGGTSSLYALLYAFKDSSATNTKMRFYECEINAKLGTDFAGSAFHGCVFGNGYIHDSGTPDTVELYDCEIGDDGTNAVNITVTARQYLWQGCRLNRKFLINTAGTQSHLITGNIFGTSGASGSWLHVKGGAAGRISFAGNQVAAPADATGAIYIEDISANFEIAITGANQFNRDSNALPLITSADASCRGIIQGNLFEADSAALYVEDRGGFSVSGLFSQSVFGSNYPGNKTQYNITGSNNEFYPAASAVGSSTGGPALNSEAYVTIGNTSGLSAERALTAGSGITITDGGANSTVTVAQSARMKAGYFSFGWAPTGITSP